MKNKITKYILLAFICLGLQACLFQEDDLFEKFICLGLQACLFQEDDLFEKSSANVLLKMWQSCRSCW